MSLFLLPQTYYEESGGAGYNDDGRYVDGTLVLKSFLGTIQPMTSKELMTFPEGERDQGIVKVYSDRRLPVSEQGEIGIGALVVFGDERYRCRKESIYSSGLISHFKYVAYKVRDVVEPVGD